MTQLVRAYEELRAAAPILIDDTPARNMLQITANARRLKLRQKIGLIVVDYIQLVDSEESRDSRQEQIAKISRRLKTLARELDVPVIALSQLNRAVENREDRRPRMADLRESGAIEQDADLVLLLHRPEYYDANDQPGIAEVIIAKNRNGATETREAPVHQEHHAVREPGQRHGAAGRGAVLSRGRGRAAAASPPAFTAATREATADAAHIPPARRRRGRRGRATRARGRPWRSRASGTGCRSE